jgi:integrase/recombinase XerD
MEELQHHNPTTEQGIIVRCLAQEYLKAQAGSPKTKAIREKALNQLQRFLEEHGRERLQDITSADLEAWRLGMLERQLAPASVDMYVRAIRQFFGWLEQSQRLFLNPAARLVVPRLTRKVLPVPTPAEVQQLLAQPDPSKATGLRDRALLETIYTTGITAGELRTLQCQDVDGDRMQVRGVRPRKLPLGSRAEEWLRRYLEQGRPKLLGKVETSTLWIISQGGPLSPETLQQILRRHCLAAGIATLSPSALRRACARHRWRAGTHPLELQLLLGHSSMQMLAQYLRVGVRGLFNPPEASHEAKNLA